MFIAKYMYNHYFIQNIEMTLYIMHGENEIAKKC